MDTANVLQIRAALDLVAADIEELRRILGDLAKRYRDTPMAGRTHLQQALPITFGYKAAIWRAMFDRHAERLAQLRPRVLVVEFAGPPARWRRSAIAASTCSGARRGAGSRRACLDLARRTRRLRRSRQPPRADHRLARQDRLRRDAHDAERARRSVRAVRHRPRRQQHDAAEAQSDLERAHARGRQGGAPARGPDARRDGAGLRARDRPVARGVDRDSRELRAHAPARSTRRSSCSAD